MRHTVMLFEDRTDAGRRLAWKLGVYANRSDVLVLALPRGGVPVAAEVARALHAPLDLFLVRKLGVPGQEELGMGAVATGDVRVLNEDLIRDLKIPPAVIEAVTLRERQELVRQAALYRGNRPTLNPRGKVLIVVDDGLATGFSMYTALTALRQREPARMIIAVPVAAPSVYGEFHRWADEIICVATPHPFGSVGNWYQDFSQTSDEDVRRLLCESEQKSEKSVH